MKVIFPVTNCTRLPKRLLASWAQELVCSSSLVWTRNFVPSKWLNFCSLEMVEFLFSKTLKLFPTQPSPKYSYFFFSPEYPTFALKILKLSPLTAQTFPSKCFLVEQPMGKYTLLEQTQAFVLLVCIHTLNEFCKLGPIGSQARIWQLFCQDYGKCETCGQWLGVHSVCHS